VTFSLDEIGQVIRRDETKPSNAPSTQVGAPHEVWYRFGEREFGYLGNNGTNDVSMAASIDARQVVGSTNPGTYRNGAHSGVSVIDFTRGIERVNSYEQGSKAGGYTVRSGDTLQGIAQRLYGDASLWYKIAEVNGLGAGAGLIAGQQLTLPSGVVRSSYNAGTRQSLPTLATYALFPPGPVRY